MVVELKHPMKPQLTRGEAARGEFVSALRHFILVDLAADMRHAYDTRASGLFAAEHGHTPDTGEDVHVAMRPDPSFKIYSAMRVQAQHMVWSSVSPTVDRELERLEGEAAAVSDLPGSVIIDQTLAVPRNVSAIDVHLMPGSYVSGSGLRKGAIYDQGLAVFSMGLMGDNLDDIGQTMAGYVRARWPEFQPRDILDMGCTIGHNTVPWKRAYPDARVQAIDVAAPGLLYGSARAKMQGAEIHFAQMSADDTRFADGSFDLVFSSMFLHEISAKTRRKVFEEARRLLRPGGLMLHMELPPNREVGAFEGFYLDWDSYYNEEPFYKGFRDEDYRQTCIDAGFDAESYVQFVAPSVGIYGKDVLEQEARTDEGGVINSETTGRLTEGVRWFGFGSWKRA